MTVRLGVEEVGLILKKYVDERTPVSGFYLHPQLKAKISGHVDSVTSSGLVVRSKHGDFFEVDIAGASKFEMGDARDVPQEVQELARRFTSSLCFRLASGAIVALYENAEAP